MLCRLVTLKKTLNVNCYFTTCKKKTQMLCIFAWWCVMELHLRTMSESVQRIFIVNQLQNTSVKIAALAKKSDSHDVIANKQIAYIYIFQPS